MELRQYWSIVWRWKWLIILATVLAAVAAFVTSSLQTPIYEATTTLLISEAPQENVSDYTALLTSERLARTYAQMLTKRPVLEETDQRLGLNLSPQELEGLPGAISVELVRDTQLISVSVEDPSPVRAAAIANTLVQVFAEQNDEIQQDRFSASKASLSEELAALGTLIHDTQVAIDDFGEPATNGERAELQRLEANLAQYRQSYTNLLQSYEALRIAEARTVSNVVQVEEATIPTEPVRPRRLMNTLLAAVVGGMIAVGAVFLIEYLDTTLKTPEEVIAKLDLPVIGVIARMEEEVEGEPHVAKQPRSPVSEAFRSLRSNIEFAAVGRPLRTLAITSPGPSEGKSTVVTNLAMVMAQAGKRVLVVDADLRKPRVHRLMGVPNRVGLSDLFVSDPLNLRGMARGCRMDNLKIVTSGGLPPNPAELLGSNRMRKILELACIEADIVLLDTPPAGAVTDAIVLSAAVDAVLLLVQPGQTTEGAALQVLDQMRRAGANIIGVALNNVALGRSGYYYDGYYSGYYKYYGGDGYAHGEDGRGARSKRGKRKHTSRAAGR